MEYMDETLTDDEFTDEDDGLVDDEDDIETSIETGRNSNINEDGYAVHDEDTETAKSDVTQNIQNIEEHEDTDEPIADKNALFSDDTKETDNQSELPPMEYVSQKHEEFMQKYKGNASLEEKWNALRSQINSGLMLHVQQKDIDKYATLEFDYMQREVLKFFIWQGASEQLVDIMMTKATHGEMVSTYDAYKAADRASELFEKATTNITQVLQSYVDSFTVFKEETAKRSSEYEEKIKSLDETISSKETEIHEKNEEADNLRTEIERLNNSINEEKKRLENEREIERRVNEIIELRMDERQALERQVLQHQQNVVYEKKRKAGIFGRRQKGQPSKSVLFRQKEKLPDNFSLSDYMIGHDLSAAQMEIITMAVKCGVNDSIIKQMIDSGKSSAQLKQILELILAKRQAEGHQDDISEEDIIYDEQ